MLGRWRGKQFFCCLSLFFLHLFHSSPLIPSFPVGYVNAQLEKEVPIFTKQRIDFTPSERITSLVVSCNQLCMSLGKDTLLR